MLSLLVLALFLPLSSPRPRGSLSGISLLPRGHGDLASLNSNWIGTAPTLLLTLCVQLDTGRHRMSKSRGLAHLDYKDLCLQDGQQGGPGMLCGLPPGPSFSSDSIILMGSTLSTTVSGKHVAHLCFPDTDLPLLTCPVPCSSSPFPQTHHPALQPHTIAAGDTHSVT